LSDDEIKIYREFLRRRSKSEPLQYILGRVEFYGLEFKVNPSVLIPRQETEILIETVLNSVNKSDKLKILDIGTGSGNISVSLASHLPCSEITTIDNSESALATAKLNAEHHHVAERIKFILYDIHSDESLDDQFDIVVSNPPYISEEEFPNLKDELKIYEPKYALTDSSDGLSYFKVISGKAEKILCAGGKIFFETGQGQSENVIEILSQSNFSEISVVKDYLNINRVVHGVLK
jgi:release factor glutamine methyltransferase